VSICVYVRSVPECVSNGAYMSVSMCARACVCKYVYVGVYLSVCVTQLT
jgi:hypothetical protein